MIRTTATLLTGFSGLVYEVTWQKCLATLLGSHSEATAAVLALFLGGLAVGYSLFGRATRVYGARIPAAARASRLLIGYGFLEAGIGTYALLFPSFFKAVQNLSIALPELPGPLRYHRPSWRTFGRSALPPCSLASQR